MTVGEREGPAAPEAPPDEPVPRGEAARLLRLLSLSGERPLSVDDLRGSGVHAPAQAVYELRLAGHPIESRACAGAGGRAAVGYRLRAVRGEPSQSARVEGAREVT